MNKRLIPAIVLLGLFLATPAACPAEMWCLDLDWGAESYHECAWTLRVGVVEATGDNYTLSGRLFSQCMGPQINAVVGGAAKTIDDQLHLSLTGTEFSTDALTDYQIHLVVDPTTMAGQGRIKTEAQNWTEAAYTDLTVTKVDCPESGVRSR